MTATTTAPATIDLRSDIIAPSTPEMLAAMASAEVGVAMWAEDPAVARLESVGAATLGVEDCAFVPNATSANLLAMLAQAARGSAVLLDRTSHINEIEWYGITALCGALPMTISSDHGHLDPAVVAAALAEHEAGRAARVGVLVLENTHTFAGGVVMQPAETQALAGLAHSMGAAVHLDGARLFNASAALGVPLPELTVGLDTVTVSLSKGLCAPVGALLGGRAAPMARIREIARNTGLARTHKAGYLAAAGLIALETMRDRLVDDHRRARQLAEALLGIDGVRIDLDLVQTNIVVAHLDARYGDSTSVAQRLHARGLLMLPYSGGRLRAVTHRGIDDEDIAKAVDSIRSELA